MGNMKIDEEQVLFEAHKLDARSFDCNDNALQSVALKSVNGAMKENHDRVSCNLKGGKGDMDQFECPTDDKDCWAAQEHADAVEVMDYELRSQRAHESQITGMRDNDSVLFMDKSVTEHELPELIICYKEETCSVVKDICVDEGVPSQDKFLFDIDVEENNMKRFPVPENGIKNEIVNKGITSDMTKSPAETETERVDTHSFTTDTPEHYDEKGFKNDLCVEYDFKDVVTNIEAKDGTIDKIAEGGTKIFSLGELLSMPNFGMELSTSRTSSDKMKEVEQHSLQNSRTSALAMHAGLEESENGSSGATMKNSIFISGAEQGYREDETILETNSALNSIAPKPDDSPVAVMVQNTEANSVARQSDSCQEEPVLKTPSISTCEEVKSTRPALHFFSEDSTSAITDELSDSNKLKTGISTFDTNPSSWAGSEKEESPQRGDCEHTKSYRSSTSNEDANTEPASSQIQQYDPGESSFSAAVPPVTGLISYSGPIAYSGSLSLRSESSTTSTRSFAFPILQSEWNTSPVRMAKAERRERGWKHTLLCCRF